MGPEAKRKIKRFLANFCPPLLIVAQTIRRTLNDRREQRIARQIAVFRQAFSERCNWTVQHGPMRGLKYRHNSRSDALLPRLVGCYEAEVHPFIETALARRPSVIVDIGCEEGYVAAGLAFRLPNAKTYAFDIELAAQGWCREMAQLNGLEKSIVIDGECTHEKLQAILGPRGLIFCDCEGFEYEILDPTKVPALRTTDMIVELHDHTRTDVSITPALKSRFAATHTITIVDRMPREESAYPCLQWLLPEQRPLALREPRLPFQQWAFLQAKEHS